MLNEPVAVVVESVVAVQSDESSHRQTQGEEELRRRVTPHSRVRELLPLGGDVIPEQQRNVE